MKKLFVLPIVAMVLTCCDSVGFGAGISGTITYPGSQTGPIRVTASQSTSGNQVLQLSGAGTVEINSLTSLAGPNLSIQFWFKGSTVQSAVRQQSGGNYIIAGYNGGHLTSTDGALGGALNGVTDGNWHHVIMTRNQNGTLSGYVDGVLKASIPAANSPLPNVNSPVYFGSVFNAGEFTIGELDEIAIWNRTLPMSEIATNWGQPLATNAPGLVGYWKFDDGTYLDSTTNGYNGTPFGDATIVSDAIPIYSQTIVVAGPGAYTITNVPAGNGYSVTAFMDANTNGLEEFSEPSGAYVGNPFTVSGSLTGVNIALTEPPYIEVQPQAPAGNRVAVGGNVGFSVTARGTPTLSYHWFLDDVVLTNNARISGATGPNLQITGLVLADNGGYSCVVSNSLGSVASLAPQLYVIANGRTISGSLIYTGTQTGLVHTTVAKLRTDNLVLNLSNSSTNFAVTTLLNLSGNALSIEYWFKGTGNFSAVRQQGGPGFIIAGWNGNLDILSFDGGTSGLNVSNPSSLVNDGKWHHMAMTWQQNTVNGFRTYLDGNLVAQRNSANVPIPNIGTQVYFGSFNGVAEFANGQFDEIAIWHIALTQSQIRSDAVNGLTGSEPGLLGYWNFDDGVGADLTPMGNNAELHNGATITPAMIPGQGAVYTDVFTNVGPYMISAIPAGTNYSLSAFLDANGNGSQGVLEPSGAYAGNPFNLSASLSGANIVLYDPPIILTNPVTVAVLQGGTIQLNAVVSGTSNMLQWFHYSAPLADGSRVSGSQSNTLTITGALLSDAGAYSLMASNLVGTANSLAGAVIVQPSTLTNQLIGYWKFDDGAGTAAAESTGLSQAGQLFNFPSSNSEWVSGIIGGALNFSDPTNQNYAIAPNYAKPTNTMSVSVWVWADSVQPGWSSIAKNWGDSTPGQFHLGLIGGVLQNQMTDGGGNGYTALDTAPLPLMAWQHIVFTADGVRMRLYRNGVQVAQSATYNGALFTPPMAGLGIGVKTDNSGNVPSTGAPGYWNGKLDDLGIWGRALSADEIFGLYQNGLAGKGIAQASAVTPVTLSVTLSGNQVTIYYAAGTLQGADNLTGPWSNVTGAIPPSFTTTATAMKFFRVH